MTKGRLEAFSDGVIAIIITIMVLELKAPEGSSWEEVKPLMPKFIGYALSFLFVAVYWVNHHHLLHTIKKVTSGMMWANINLLFWLSLVPFATAWMGESHFEKMTVVVYAVLALLCGMSFNFLQGTIAKHLAADSPLKAIINPGNWKNKASIFLYALSIPMALLVNSYIAGGLFFLVQLFWIIPDKKIEKALMEEEE